MVRRRSTEALRRGGGYSVGGTFLTSVDLFTVLVNSILNFFAFTLECGELGQLESLGSLLKEFDENPLNLAQA